MSFCSNTGIPTEEAAIPALTSHWLTLANFVDIIAAGRTKHQKVEQAWLPREWNSPCWLEHDCFPAEKSQDNFYLSRGWGCCLPSSPSRVSTPLNSVSGMLACTFRGGSGAIPLLWILLQEWQEMELGVLSICLHFLASVMGTVIYLTPHSVLLPRAEKENTYTHFACHVKELTEAVKSTH